jgi:diphthine synthase
MLFLIGLGLSTSEIPIGAILACKESAEIYSDSYTSKIPDETIGYIKTATGKQIIELGRSDMEEKAATLVKKAAKADIAVLMGGDPLIATTHKILFIEARKQNVKTKVIHGSSITSAAMGSSGLDFYRFGKSCTIPRWSENYKPVSFYETIAKNLEINAHTLLLLDYDAKSRSTLPIKDSLLILDAAESHYKKGIIDNQRKIIILNNISQADEKLVHTTIGEAKTLQLDGMNVIILYSALTEIEKEVLDTILR